MSPEESDRPWPPLKPVVRDWAIFSARRGMTVLGQLFRRDPRSTQRGIVDLSDTGPRGADVVFICPPLFRQGGGSRYLYELAKAASVNHRVAVIAQEQVSSDQARDFGMISHFEVVKSPQALESAVCRQIGGQTDATVILAQSPWGYLRIASIRKRLPQISRVHDLHFNSVGHLGKLFAARQDIDGSIVAYASLGQQVSRICGPSHHTLVIYAGIPDCPKSRVDPGPPPNPASRKIAWIGRPSREKRFDLLVDIAKRLPDIHFECLGSGLREAYPPEKLPSNIAIHGWVPDVHAFLSDVDALLNTSDAEGIPVSVLESLRAGVPVISRRVGGIPEAIRDGRTGLFYSHSDLDGLVSALSNESAMLTIREGAASSGLPAEYTIEQMHREFIGFLAADKPRS